MIISHSINTCVDEIIEFNKRRQFLKINLIGMSGSGKTTLSRVLAHQIHTKADVPYEVKFFKDEQLVNFKATVQALSNNNQILIFDDLSGLVSKFGKIALDKVKAEITTIRHINDQEDRKIIMILNFHAQKLLDKSLRISNFSFYTDCQLEEVGYLEELLGKSQINKINKFQRLRAQSGIYHKFVYTLGKKDFFVYKEMDPFLPLLYNNGLNTRHVVSPSLEWILDGKECSTCKPAIQSAETKFNLDLFMIDYCKKFTKGIAKRAVELKLLQEGINTQPKRVLQAREYIEQYLREKKINLQELADAFNLKERATKLFPDKQPNFEEPAQ
jgi:ABC-type dipeptide/oligopeptide/nickel transport system ATPase component